MNIAVSKEVHNLIIDVAYFYVPETKKLNVDVVQEETSYSRNSTDNLLSTSRVLNTSSETIVYNQRESHNMGVGLKYLYSDKLEVGGGYFQDREGDGRRYSFGFKYNQQNFSPTFIFSHLETLGLKQQQFLFSGSYYF